MADTVVRLRPATLADLPFLYEMFHEANHWSLPPEAPRPPLAGTLAEEIVSRYVDDWGRPGDCGIIAAESRRRRRLLDDAAVPGG